MIKELVNKLDKKSKYILPVIFVVQILLLAYVYSQTGLFDAVDSDTYRDPAISFINCGLMNDGLGPTLSRTPGYILFLSLIYSLTNNSDYVVVAIQCLMFISITYIIYYLVTKLSKHSILGCLASAFYICDIVNYQYAISIMTDIPFSFFLLLSFVFLFKYLDSKKYKDILFCFLSLNFTLSIRPQIMYFSILVNIALVVLLILKKINFKILLTYVMLFCLVFFGWSYRNYVRFDKFTYTPIRDRDYFMYYAPIVYGHVNDVSIDEARVYFDEILYEQYEDFDSYEIMQQVDAMAGIGKDYVSDNFTAFIICNFKGLFAEMVAPNQNTIAKFNISDSLKTIIGYICAGILLMSYIIYAIGFLSNITKHKWYDWLILVTVMYLMASTAIVGYSRYRIAFYALSLIGTFSSTFLSNKENINE